MTIEVNKVLLSGAIVHDLKSLISNDFIEAQRIFDDGDFTNNLDAESAYNERVENDFVGTYEMTINSYSDYRRFKTMLSFFIPDDKHPTLEQWIDNKIVVNGQDMKLSKWLIKQGVSSEVIDFYSSQVRTGKEVWFFTVSDMVQHIAGMTAYSNVFTSCMSPDREESIALSGALHDDKLLIGMLHRNIDDVKDMDGHLDARVCMRVVHIEGVQHLIPSIYYGSVQSKEIMNRCISHLEELHIHTREIRSVYGADSMEVIEEANGCYELPMVDDVHIMVTIDEYIKVPCPMCNGSKVYQTFSSVINKDVSMVCMVCNGSGVYSVHVYEEVNDYKEIEELSDIITNADDYEHDGERIVIGLDREKFTEHMREYGN